MSAQDRDPFALARQGGDDADIRALFREWIAEVRRGAGSPDQEALDAFCDRTNDLERQIDELPAQGAAGLAIKAYLYLFWTACHDRDADPASVSPANDDGTHAVAVLRDAARFVPEIAELIGGEAQS